MFSDRVSNPGPMTYESGALPIALRGLAFRSFSRKLLRAKAMKLGLCIHLEQ